MRRLFPAVLVLLVFSALSSAYIVNVDADDENCYFERVIGDTKTRMAMIFEVAEGGFLDIGVKITAPDGREIYEVERETSGHYTFLADQTGVYHFCLSNKFSTVTPKVVVFSIETTVNGVKPPGKSATHDSEAKKLEEMVQELSVGMKDVQHEQQYLLWRKQKHHTLNSNTNRRVVLWAFFETFLLVTVTLGQMWYLKRFFEVRCAV